jgi:hypothetical protein
MSDITVLPEQGQRPSLSYRIDVPTLVRGSTPPAAENFTPDGLLGWICR